MIYWEVGSWFHPMSETVTIEIDDEEVEVPLLIDDPNTVEVELEVNEPVIIVITEESS